MPATTPRGYPYSLLTDPADVPEAIEALALAVDQDVQNVADTVTPRPSFRLSSTTPVSFPTWVAFPVSRAFVFDTVDMNVGSAVPTAFPVQNIVPRLPGYYWVDAYMLVPREGSTTMQSVSLSVQNATTTLSRQTIHGPPPAVDGVILLQVQTGAFFNGTTDFVQVVGSTQTQTLDTGDMTVNRAYMSMTRMTES